MKKEMKAGALVAHALKQEGVEYIFGLPGGHIYPAMNEAEKLGMKFICTRHEMHAAFAAEGWALTTGKLGVCAGTAGPGVTNLLTGMANAYMGKYPVFYLGGKSRVTENDRNELQDFDQISIIQNMSKHARTVYEPLRIPEYVSRAVSYATNGTPGPAYIEVPRDLNDTYVNFDDVPFADNYKWASRVKAADEDIQKAVAMIKEAKKPIVIAGSGVWWSQGQDKLKAFVEKADIPFCTRNAARGCISDKHELYVSIGCNDPITMTAVAQSDLVIIVGTRASYTLNRNVISANQKIIRIDIDPVEVTNQWDAELAIVGDAKAVLAQLADAVEPAAHPEWKAGIQRIKTVVAEGMAKLCPDPLATPINPIAFFKLIAEEVDEDTIVVIDGGDMATWAVSMIPAYGPGQLLGIANNAYGPLGVGMGYAMAAKLAHPEKKVMLIVGDGAFGYGAMELDTCMRYGIDINVVVFNDSMWGMIKRSESRQAPDQKEFVGLDLREETHYEEVAKGLGGYGEFVTDIKDLRAAIQRGVDSGKPSCINVMVDPKIGPKGAGC